MRGGGPTVYGAPGDRCPECDVLLSKYNPVDHCNQCGGGKLRPKRGAEASACSAAAPLAAPEPRRVPQEDFDMAVAQRQETSASKAAVVAALTDTYQTAPAIAHAAACKEALAYYHLARLRDCGRVEHKMGAGGGYRLRQDAAAKAAAAKCDNGPEATLQLNSAAEKCGTRRSVDLLENMHAETVATLTAEDAPADPTGAAPAPTTAQQEQPANQAAGPNPSTGPPPFAGIDPMEKWRRAMDEYLSAGNSELRVLSDLDAMDDDARERVLQYAVDRWWKFPEPMEA